MKSSVITLLCRPDLTVGTAVTELGNLNAVGEIAFPRWQRPNGSTRQGSVVTIMDSRFKAALRNKTEKDSKIQRTN